MYVNVTQLDEAAPSLRAVGARVESVAGRLTAALDAEGTCWGCDEIGAAFGASYLPAAQQTRDSLPELAGAIAEVAIALRRIAENAAGADARATQRQGLT